MKTFLSDFDILTNKRVMPHHSFTVQLTTISADDDITRNDGTCRITETSYTVILERGIKLVVEYISGSQILYGTVLFLNRQPVFYIKRIANSPIQESWMVGTVPPYR